MLDLHLPFWAPGRPRKQSRPDTLETLEAWALVSHKHNRTGILSMPKPQSFKKVQPDILEPTA